MTRRTTVLDRALGLLSYRIEPEGVSVATQIAEKTPPVLMNANNMQQVFLNVLINALDALSESNKDAKEVEVDIRPERERVQSHVRR